MRGQKYKILLFRKIVTQLRVVAHNVELFEGPLSYHQNFWVNPSPQIRVFTGFAADPFQNTWSQWSFSAYSVFSTQHALFILCKGIQGHQFRSNPCCGFDFQPSSSFWRRCWPWWFVLPALWAVRRDEPPYPHVVLWHSPVSVIPVIPSVCKVVFTLFYKAHPFPFWSQKKYSNPPSCSFFVSLTIIK